MRNKSKRKPNFNPNLKSKRIRNLCPCSIKVIAVLLCILIVFIHKLFFFIASSNLTNACFSDFNNLGNFSAKSFFILLSDIKCFELKYQKQLIPINSLKNDLAEKFPKLLKSEKQAFVKFEKAIKRKAVNTIYRQPILGPPITNGSKPLFGYNHKGTDAIFALACNYPL
jgi:hypothetical protein